MRRLKLTIAVAATIAAARIAGADEPRNALPEEVAKVLASAAEVELYSLDAERAGKGEPEWRGWKLLGKTTVKGDAKKEVLAAVTSGAEEGPKYGAKCFDPRHGVKATHDGKTVQLVICFECSWVYASVGDGEATKLTISGEPQKVLDRVLTEAKVPLPKGPNR